MINETTHKSLTTLKGGREREIYGVVHQADLLQ